MTSLSERLAGAVLGHLVGDAVGVPYEFLPASAITTVEFRGGGHHDQKPGTWSDDGALMLALLDSLVRERGAGEPRFDTADQARRALAWADDRAYTPDGDGLFDMGSATRRALGRLRKGAPAEQAGGTKEHDNGNGSLMRILPLALVERDVAPDALVDHAHAASAVTHGHPLSQAACALYSLVVRGLLAGTNRETALTGARTELRALYSDRDDAAVRLAALDTLEGWTGRAGKGYVIDAFWSAWDAFAAATSYCDTIERAIRYGNDTDTTACIAGGLAGAHFGFDAIPKEWVAGMRGLDLVEPLVGRLLASLPPEDALTSENNPISVAWIDFGRPPTLEAPAGRLGMTFLPGKQAVGVAGNHKRDLRADVARLREEQGVDTLVLLVEDHELQAFGVAEIVEVMATHGIETVRLPIRDGGVPTHPAAVRTLLDDVTARLATGERVVVACRGGLGRTGTIVALLLRTLGADATGAIEATRAARPGAIETAAQETFVRDWPST